MCFHSKQTKDATTAQNRFKATVGNPLMFQTSEHYNGFSFPRTPVITNKNPQVIDHLCWGLIPAWAKDISIRNYTLNAKIETLNAKPSFKASVANRCLVLADGFYEWQWLDTKGKKKQKYLITLPDNNLFAFAGIWAEWVDKLTGEIVNSYSVLTTEANELMSSIHNSKKRMPIILNPENEQQWLLGDNITNFKTPNTQLTATPIF